MPTVAKVEAHHDEYPYPPAEMIVEDLPEDFSRGVLNFLLRRRDADRLPRRAKIWVAGCGTQQGAAVALSYPSAQVLATDISTKTLAIASSVAEQIGIPNLTFEQQDLLATEQTGSFDLVFATGVLHHLPDPLLGMKQIRAALRPRGAAVIMVYSAAHRQVLSVARRTLLALSRYEPDPDDRYELACRLVEQVLESPRCRSPHRDVLETLWEQRETSRPLVADALMHPLEHAYRLDDFFALLRSAGLAFSTWAHPHEWDVSQYLTAPDLAVRIGTLDELQQWHAIEDLAGFGGPIFKAVVEPADAPKCPPLSEEELLAITPMLSGGFRAHRIEDNKVVETFTTPAFRREADALRVLVRGPTGVGTEWTLPQAVLKVVDLVDGKRSVGDMLPILALDGIGLETIERLLPTKVGLLAPR